MESTRIISMVLAIAMVFSLFAAFPLSAGAASTTDADFFAKLNYSAYPKLSAVKAAVDKGDYDTAKAELLKYFKERHAEGEITGFGISESDEFYGMAVLPMRNILTGPYEFDMWQGEFTVTSAEFADYTVDVTDRIADELNNGAVSFMLFAGNKQRYPVYVKSKEAGDETAPRLVISYQKDGGETQTVTIIADNDTYISSGNTSSTYGSETQLVVKEDGSGSDSTGSNTRRTYINFPLAEAANSTILSAELIVNAAYAEDCDTGDKDVLVINIGDTIWDENSLTWAGTRGSIYSYEDAANPTWAASALNADSEYHNVTSRFWFGRPMAYEYLSYLADPDTYNANHPYSDTYPGADFGPKLVELMSAFASQRSYGYTRTLETGERLNRWVDIVDAFLETDVFDTRLDEFVNILSFMWGDCNWLNGKSITDGSEWWSNWRAVANAGFFKAVEFLPEFKTHDTWRAKVESNVEYTLDLLYNDDMSFAEAGPSYNAWCAKLFGDCVRAADMSGNPMSSEFLVKVRYAARNALESYYPNGYDTNIGDSNYRDQMAYFEALDEIFDEEDEIIHSYVTGTDDNASYLSSFYSKVNSAYLRNTWNPDNAVYVNFSNNPSDGHYHPDSNEVLLYAYGQPLLVDSGRYSYSSTNSIYNELRYASAHNTIEAVGVSLGTHANSASAGTMEYTTNDKFDFVANEQHGYSGVSHTRRVLYLREGYAIVSDYVDGSNASQEYRQNWHFLPSSNPEADGKTAKTAFYQKPNVIIANAEADATIRDGYHSADYGLVANSKYASFSQTGADVKFNTVLYPVNTGETATVTATDLASGDLTKSAMKIEGTVEGMFYVKNSDSSDGKFGDYYTDADMAYVTADSVMMAGGTTLTDNGTTVVSSPAEIGSLALTQDGTALYIDGENLGAATDEDSAIKISLDGVEKLYLNGEEIELKTDSDGYIVSVASTKVKVTVSETKVLADKDGFAVPVLSGSETDLNEGKTKRDYIQASAAWRNRNSYVGFDLTDYADGDFSSAVVRMTVTEAASGGAIHFYFLDYGDWTRDDVEFVLDSTKMPSHTANAGTYTGYSYHFTGDVSGIGVGSTFEVDFTSQLKEYLANGGDPKFTLAILSGVSGSTKFASLENETYDGPAIVFVKKTTEGTEIETTADVSFVTSDGTEIADEVKVSGLTPSTMYIYDAPEFIDYDGVKYALDNKASSLGTMLAEGENALTAVYVPAAEITVQATIDGADYSEAIATDYAAPGKTYTYTPDTFIKVDDETGGILNEEASTLSLKAASGEANVINAVYDKVTIKSENLVTNPGFEESLDGWYSIGTSGVVQAIGGGERTNETAAEGEYSYKQTTGGGGQSGNNLFGQFSLGDASEGKSYVLAFKRYGGGSADSVTLTTGLSDSEYASGTNIPSAVVDESCGGLGNTGTSTVSCNLTGLPSDEWHQLAYVLTAGANSKYAVVYARWSEGQYFDDFELYEIESESFPVDVTVKYVDKDGNEIADAETLSATIGTVVDGADYVLPSREKSKGVRYVYDSEATGSTELTVSKDGENVIKLVYSEQEYDGIVLDLSFDDEETGLAGGLGVAEAKGGATLVDDEDGKVLSLDGTGYLSVENKDGGSLLTGLDEITIVYKNKIESTNTGANWVFYASDSAAAPVYGTERYLGALEKSNALTVERYNNSGSRPENPSATVDNEWKQVAVVVSNTKTQIYVDGVLASEKDSAYLLSDMLEDDSIFQIGKANWGSGEYYTGLIDDFKIYDYAFTAEEVAALVPAKELSFTFDGTTATVENAEGAFVIIIAQYDSDGKLVGIQTTTDASLEIEKAEDAVKVKAFLWNGLEGMVPATSAIALENEEE